VSLVKKPKWVVFDFLGVLVPFGITSAVSYLGINQKHVVDDRLVEFMGELVEAGISLAVASNSGRAWIESVLDYTKDLPEIKAIITPEIGVIKPNEAYFRHVLSVLNAEPQAVVFIDDSQTNCEAAEKLGMRTFWYQANLADLKRLIQALPD
jgi:putative hydrolase of the HAD superfamily